MLDCHMSSDYDIYTLPVCLWFVLRWLSHPALVRFLDTSQCVLLSFSSAECSWKAESRAVPLKPCTPEWDFWEGKRGWGVYEVYIGGKEPQISASQILLEKHWEGTGTVIVANMLKRIVLNDLQPQNKFEIGKTELFNFCFAYQNSWGFVYTSQEILMPWSSVPLSGVSILGEWRLQGGV